MSWEMPSEIHKCVPAWPTVHRRLPDGGLFGNDQIIWLFLAQVELHEVVEVSEKRSFSPLPLTSLEKPPHFILSLRLPSM